jgi:putative phage-type endonuclease
MNTTLIPYVGPDALTPEWHAARKNGIGASEAAAACGLSPWKTPLDIYCLKLGLIPEVVENDAMRLGKRLEPVVVDEYVDRTGNEVVRPCPMYTHPEHSFMFATPDGRVPNISGILECKTTTWRTELGDESTDWIPEDWLAQTHQQMAVMQVDRCDVAVLVDGRTLRIFNIQRNDELVEAIIASEKELWERIQAKDPPPPIWEHPHTPALIKAMFRTVTGDRVELSEELTDVWHNSQELGKRIKEMETERERERSQVALGIGNAAIGLLNDGTEVARIHVKETLVEAYTRKAYFQLRERKAR